MPAELGQPTGGVTPPEKKRKPQLTPSLAKDLNPTKVASLLSGRISGTGDETIINFPRLDSFPAYIRIVDKADGSKQMLLRQKKDAGEKDITSYGLVMGTDALGDPLLTFIAPSSEEGTVTGLAITEDGNRDDKFEEAPEGHFYPEYAKARNLAKKAMAAL